MTRSIAVGVYVCLLVPLVVADQKRPAQSLRDWAMRNQARQAYGIYIKDRKIGWFVDEATIGKHEGKEVVLHTQEGLMSTSFDGEKSTWSQKITMAFDLEGHGDVVFIDECTKEDSQETVRQARRRGKELVVSTTTNGRKSERRVGLPKETLKESQRLESWLLAGPKPGDVFESWDTMLEENDINVKATYTFQGKKSILWGGVPTDVFLVRTRTQGADFDAEIKANGVAIKGKIGGLFEVRAEKEALAKKLDTEPVDLLAVSAIHVDKRLGGPKKVEALTLEVNGLGDFKLPTSHRQRLELQKDGGVLLHLKHDFRIDKPQPLTAEQRAKYLQATPTLETEDDKIRSLAKEITGVEKDPVKAATLLHQWVHDHLRQTMAANAATARAVLDNRAGDCTEHALLFTALARAVNIPAREVGGLAYLNTDKPLFGWHAWAEIHDGSQWVSIDPTWNEVYIDATHIKFSEGAEDWAWVNTFGRVKLKVVSFERKE